MYPAQCSYVTEDSTRRFAFGSKSFAFWVVLILLSVLLLIEEGDAISAIVWSLTLSMICVPLLLYRRIRLRARENELLTKGVSLDAYDYGRQRRVIGTITLLGFAGMLAPLILLGFIPVSVWFGSLIGLLDGWLLNLVLFNVAIWVWERQQGGILYHLELWNGSRVTHVGLKFQRS